MGVRETTSFECAPESLVETDIPDTIERELEVVTQDARLALFYELGNLHGFSEPPNNRHATTLRP